MKRERRRYRRRKRRRRHLSRRLHHVGRHIAAVLLRSQLDVVFRLIQTQVVLATHTARTLGARSTGLIGTLAHVITPGRVITHENCPVAAFFCAASEFIALPPHHLSIESTFPAALSGYIVVRIALAEPAFHAFVNIPAVFVPARPRAPRNVLPHPVVVFGQPVAVRVVGDDAFVGEVFRDFLQVGIPEHFEHVAGRGLHHGTEGVVKLQDCFFLAFCQLRAVDRAWIFWKISENNLLSPTSQLVKM